MKQGSLIYKLFPLRHFLCLLTAMLNCLFFDNIFQCLKKTEFQILVKTEWKKDGEIPTLFFIYYVKAHVNIQSKCTRATTGYYACGILSICCSYPGREQLVIKTPPKPVLQSSLHSISSRKTQASFLRPLLF